MGGGVTTRFLYDGAQMIGEYDGSNALLRRYVPGAGLDEPVVWYEGSGTSDRRWLIADERGSVIAVTNGSGAASTINTYDEYGIPDSSNAGRFQYTGQAWLPEAGRYHYRARTYDPNTGRFQQPDPILWAGGMNLYAYVGNDPVNGIDPSGLWPERSGVWSRRRCAVTVSEEGEEATPRFGWCYPMQAAWGGSVSVGNFLAQWQGQNDLINMLDALSPPARVTEDFRFGADLDGEGSGYSLLDNDYTNDAAAYANLARCAAEHFGLDTVLGAGAAAAGQPIPGSKPFVTPGSSDGTSIASRFSRAVLGDAQLPVNRPGHMSRSNLRIMPAPTNVTLARGSWAWTGWAARAGGRLVPFVGWGILAYDAISIGVCAAGANGTAQ